MLDWLIEWFKAVAEHVVTVPVYLAAPMMVFVGALDSSLLSLPEVNDYITIARVANNPIEVYYFPLFPAAGSVIGCLVLYRIAQRGEQFISRRFHPRHLDRVKEIYRKWGLLALVIPALLPPPMPFKIFVATAGALNYPMSKFAGVIMIARMIRYYFWGVLAFFFQNEVRTILSWMESHIIELLGAIIVGLALFFVARWLILRLKIQSSPRTADHKTQATFSD
jgi:membrane protein YqaA with SNARE-associated domain